MYHAYIHAQLSEYYKAYTTALCGMTWRESGWDCMRHYKILAAGALPYMPDIEDKPNGTMFSPSHRLAQAHPFYESFACLASTMPL